MEHERQREEDNEVEGDRRSKGEPIDHHGANEGGSSNACYVRARDTPLRPAGSEKRGEGARRVK